MSVIEAGLFMLPSGLLMAVLAPVSAAISRRFGPKTTLITGAALMAVGYVGQVLLISDPRQLLVGTTLIACGTAIGYAAMPTLLMQTVPMHETAAANGLNALLRSVGTSTGSAAVAAVLTSGMVRTGAVTAPSLGAYQQVFWLASAVAATAALVALGLPRHRPAVFSDATAGETARR
jgi:MFS family permease